MPEFLRAIPVLAARDVAANVDFWVGQLGFCSTFQVSGFAGIIRDEITLYISEVADQVIPDNTMAWIRVTDLDQLHRDWSRTVATDYEDVSAPAMTAIVDSPGGREFAVRDQAGNCVHFVEQLAG